jgi:uncharacterized protein (TIGR02145 family)
MRRGWDTVGEKGEFRAIGRGMYKRCRAGKPQRRVRRARVKKSEGRGGEKRGARGPKREMSGTSAVGSEVWCYTKQGDVVESAVRAVRGSVKSAASQRGASVWVWTKADTQTAIDNLKAHLGGIEIGKSTEPQKKADVYVEVHVGKLVVAAWRVHVFPMPRVESAVKEEPATVEDELKAAKKVIEKLHEDVKKVVQMVQEREEELAKLRAAKAELEAGLVRCGDTELRAAELGGMGLSVEWADRNLDVWKMSDGVKVVEAEREEEWGLLAAKKRVSVWCHYGGEKESCRKWGKIYSMGNGEELGKLAPQGWRIPTEGEWRELLEAHGLKFDEDGNIVYDEEREKAAVAALLGGPFKGAGNGGSRGAKGVFDGRNVYWVMTRGEDAWALFHLYEQQNVTMGGPIPSGQGYYVRCVRDKPPTQ